MLHACFGNSVCCFGTHWANDRSVKSRGSETISTSVSGMRLHSEYIRWCLHFLWARPNHRVLHQHWRCGGRITESTDAPCGVLLARWCLSRHLWCPKRSWQVPACHNMRSYSLLLHLTPDGIPFCLQTKLWTDRTLDGADVWFSLPRDHDSIPDLLPLQLVIGCQRGQREKRHGVRTSRKAQYQTDRADRKGSGACLIITMSFPPTPL